MANYKKRNYRKKGSKTKSIAWKKPTAKNQKNQIYSLQKQVNRLKSKTKAMTQYTKFDMVIPVTDLIAPVTRSQEDEDAFNVFHLTKPNEWTEIFSSGESSTLSKRCYVINCHIEGYFTPKNSTTPLTQKFVNVWLVSLKKEAAAQVLENTNDLTTTENNNGLNSTKQGEFYYTRNSNGPYSSMPMLNPKCFKIHAHRNFILGNIMQEEAGDDDVAVVDYNLVTQRVVISAKFNTKLETQTGIHGTAESWKGLTEENTEQTDRLYLITHCGGYSSDTDNGVNFAASCCFTVKTVV